MKIFGEGPIPSRIMLVGDFPSDSDERSRRPFGGTSGQELNRLLHEAGIMRSECYVTYAHKTTAKSNQLSSLVAEKKKDVTHAHRLLRDRWVLPSVEEGYIELLTEIEMVQPSIIIALGTLALWVLTGNWSVAKWRGSQLEAEGVKVIPTYPPSQVFKQFELRGVIINDLKRAKRHSQGKHYTNIPSWNFIIRPTLQQTLDVLKMLQHRMDQEPTWIEFDLETFITSKHIRCAGIGWSRTEAICIPFTDGHSPYWPSEEEEGLVVYELYKTLTHPNARVRGQNLLFDCQYTHRYWHFIPRVAHDTMISQHSCFSALPKGLDFLASMYCDYYSFWKDDK